MPQTTEVTSLEGADENPAEAGEYSPAPAAPEQPGPEPPVPGDGPESARRLADWFFRRYGQTARLSSVWRMIGTRPGAVAPALRAGYGIFRCHTHRRLNCRHCACPACGAPGGCSCGARQILPYSAHPPLPPRQAGVRRVSAELEMAFRSGRDLQLALGEYPWAHYDGSVSGAYLGPEWYDGAEFKVSVQSTRLDRLADVTARIDAAASVGAPRQCGYHVHVERAADDETAILNRWYPVQDELYGLFPTRSGNSYAEPLEPGRTYLPGHHYAVINRSSRNPTWECRIHPGTTSWIVAACWADWVHGLFAGKPAPLGEAYLNARRAMRDVTGGSKTYPWRWRRTIERWNAAHGGSVRRTLQAIAGGMFARLQEPRGLEEALLVQG